MRAFTRRLRQRFSLRHGIYTGVARGRDRGRGLCADGHSLSHCHRHFPGSRQLPAYLQVMVSIIMCNLHIVGVEDEVDRRVRNELQYYAIKSMDLEVG